MSLSSALNNAATGLTASSRLAQVTSNNVSNALTDGYARRDLTLNASALGGVRIGDIARQVDLRIIADRRLADSAVAQQQAQTQTLQRLEQSFGALGAEDGIAGRLAAFEQSLVTAGSDPSSSVRLNTVVSRLGELTAAVRSDAQALKEEREAADAAIAKDVQMLNETLAQVEALNTDIARMRNSGQDPSALMDARRLAIDEVAQIVPVRVIDRADDQVALYSKSGIGLVDGSAATFAFSATPTIVPAMSFANGALSGVTLNGQPLSTSNGFGGLKGGSLEAQFTLRDQTLPQLQNQLDAFAVDFVARFEDPATDPSLIPGSAGLLTDDGGPLDLADTTGLSARLAINAVVDPVQGGDTTALRDGMNAATPAAVGDGGQIDRFLQGLRTETTLLTGGVPRSAMGHAGDFVATVGQARLSAEERLSFASTRHEALLTAELATGVDTDREMQTLLKIEQIYAANARVLQTVDRMMQRLLEI